MNNQIKENQIGVQSNGQTETFPMTKQGFEAANKTFETAPKPRVFKLLTILVLLLFSVLSSAQNKEQMPPCRFGKCDTLPKIIAPVSLDAMTYGDKIQYYCIKELISVEGFTQLCTNRLKEKERKGEIKLYEGFGKISSDLIWEIIRNEKEPIGELRFVIDEILKPRPRKEGRKTRMDF